MENIKIWIILIFSLFIFSSCNFNFSINQETLCVVHDFKPQDNMKICKPGEKIVFVPNSWGNEQLPIYFAAFNCDLRYSVALTNGGVTCIFKPISSITKPRN